MGRQTKQSDPFYKSIAWRAVRDKALRRDRYICNHCGIRCLGRKHNKPAPHVDHIHPRRASPDLALSLDNLQTLCHSCHSKRTVSDYIDRPAIGEDGYPTT